MLSCFVSWRGQANLWAFTKELFLTLWHIHSKQTDSLFFSPPETRKSHARWNRSTIEPVLSSCESNPLWMLFNWVTCDWIKMKGEAYVCVCWKNIVDNGNERWRWWKMTWKAAVLIHLENAKYKCLGKTVCVSSLGGGCSSWFNLSKLVGRNLMSTEWMRCRSGYPPHSLVDVVCVKSHPNDLLWS